MNNSLAIHSLRLLFASFVFAAGSAHAQRHPELQKGIGPQYGETMSDPDSITVNSNVNGRPIAIAIERLQEIYGVPITYEDTRYVHESEVIDLKWNKAVVKKIKMNDPLTFHYEAPPPDAPLDVRKKLAGAALADALRNYHKQRGAEIFTVKETDKGFQVIARKFKGASGNYEDLRPLLDTDITISPAPRTIKEALDEIAKQIPLSFMFGPNTLSWSLLRTDLTATNEPARSVLNHLMDEIPIRTTKPIGMGRSIDAPEGGYTSWQLRTDPDPKWGSAVTFTAVRPPGTE